MNDTTRSTNISTQLRQIAEQAKREPSLVFTTLAHRMDVECLREAYRRLRKDAAPGISGVTAKEYGRNLEANLQDLHARLKGRSYTAPMIKRVWIDKDKGKKRPIGLSEIEDKIVQKAVTMWMGAVYEQDFYPFSYGFRENKSAHEAIREIRANCMEQNIGWIYDADITGFFDNIDRKWLRSFIKQRVNDGGLLRLIGKWLNAGVLDGEQITFSEKGTPQGGIVSPLLANIYLHHVLDDWFEREVKPQMRGRSFIVRFADDFVIGCEREDDAKRIAEILPKRFEQFGLTIHPQKSRLLSFGKPKYDKEITRGDNTFDFLGFTHYWARSRQGNWVIKRKTSSKRVRKTIVALREWCRQNRHRPLEEQYRILSWKLRGHFQYFGVRCNLRAMAAVLHFVRRGWKFWLSRRCHKKAMDWGKFEKLLESMPLPLPKIVHNV
jgi:group II intron reverse transcriptase/maturase